MNENTLRDLNTDNTVRMENMQQEGADRGAEMLLA